MPSPGKDRGMNNQTIFDRIRIARKNLGMTMEELAHKVGYVGRSTIGMVEQGKRSISHDMLVKYAEALKVSPLWLLYGDASSKIISREASQIAIKALDEVEKIIRAGIEKDEHFREQMQSPTDRSYFEGGANSQRKLLWFVAELKKKYTEDGE